MRNPFVRMVARKQDSRAESTLSAHVACLAALATLFAVPANAEDQRSRPQSARPEYTIQLDTITRGFDMPKVTPDEVVKRALDALEAGADEVLADEITQQVKRGLSAEPGVYLQTLER